jgi:hypothetical protein
MINILLAGFCLVTVLLVFLLNGTWVRTVCAWGFAHADALDKYKETFKNRTTDHRIYAGL